jgi:hypothetical protein
MTHEERFNNIENAIRDLIVVSRTVITSIEELREAQRELGETQRELGEIQRELGEIQREDHNQVIIEIRELREAQAATDEKLHALIDTVDRIIRNRNL